MAIPNILGKITIKYYTPVILFCVTLMLYAVMSFGGVRSPDSEVVFRLANSLESGFGSETRGIGEGFGVSKGTDGKYYSIFGPLESVALIPLIKLGKYLNLNKGEWYRSYKIPLSSFCNINLLQALSGKRPRNLSPHALRFVSSFFNVFITAFCVFFFWASVRKLVLLPQSALAASVLYAFGTLAWPYSGTLLSEPLATMFVLLSFYFILCDGSNFAKEGIFAGLSLGLAMTAHITSVLFLPFFAILCASFKKNKNCGKRLKPVSFFMVGFCVIALCLGYYNFIRFGSFFQTGRTVNIYEIEKFQYGHFVLPWKGLYGLLVSSGKGIFLYCPAVILGVICWPTFHRKNYVLSYSLIGIILFRILFIASRSDWHGGFCLGPRYLVMLVPFMLVPACFSFDQALKNGRTLKIILFFVSTFVCISQQVYFCLGEIFSYYHIIKLNTIMKGVDILKDNRLYLDWQTTPLLNLLKGRRGPFILQGIALDNIDIWAVFTLVIGVIMLAKLIFLLKDKNITVI